MTTGPVQVRELVEADRDLLLRATLTNLNWSGPRFIADEVAKRPEFARYLTVKPARGDFGLVAMAGDGVVGVVWVLYLPAADAGYGYVADGVGELSVCVFEGHRGEGIGSRIIELALRRAAGRGDDRVSLSVEPGNPARELYGRLGFRDVDHAPDTMVASVSRE